MQIIKPLYSYTTCCNIYDKERELSNYNVKNPIVWGLNIVKITNLFIAAYFVYLYLCYGIHILLDIIKKNMPTIGERNTIIITFVVLIIIPIIIFYLFVNILNIIPNNIKDRLIKIGKLRLNRLQDNKEYKDYWELRTIYHSIDWLVSLPLVYLEESDYYKTDNGLEVVVKDNGYITRKAIYLGKYKRDICKENCIDFSVLDNKLEEIVCYLKMSDSTLMVSGDAYTVGKASYGKSPEFEDIIRKKEGI